MTDAIVHDVERAARIAPAAPALSWRGTLWTYADLQRAVACVKGRVLKEGLTPGARVALLLRNSPQYVATLYGAMAAECIAVPLNVQEHASLILRQLEHVQCTLLVADREHPQWPAVAGGLGEGIRVIPLTLSNDACASEEFYGEMGSTADNGASNARAGDPAMIIYTSGTMANPKGVVLSHGALAANARAIVEYLEIDATDKVLSVLPFHFSYGNSVLNSNLIAGAHILIEDNLAFPHLTLRRMQDERVTGFPGVPSTFALLLGRCSLEEYDLSNLRYITQAGGAMPRAHIEQLQRLLPHVRTFVMYGQTEATARLTFLPPEKLSEKMGSVGLPLPNVEIQVRAEGRALPAGEIGEICARGPSVMLGYWRDAALSAELLRDGWLHTGDLGHFDRDGYLFIDGRAQEMIKVGAFRVSPQEIEEVLAECAGVEQAAVVAISDDFLGQAVKAIVVPRPGAETSARAVKAHCKKRLAGYKVPKVVEFVATLPRTSSGKIQRFKLL
jgi:acyl-CoA synthetase (AMP-forming)/AMP-acid ligase II